MNIFKTQEEMRHSEKLQLSCSVPMLALLIRFMKESGYCEGYEVSVLIRFFATHFETPKQPEISSQSLRAKYDKPLAIHLDLFKEWMEEGLKLRAAWDERMN